MGVFLFVFIAILLFWKFADLSRLKELFPILMTAIFMRFLDHFIIIDWLRLWPIFGPPHFRLWIPISANLTVWPCAVYLYFQYMPAQYRWLYSAFWIATMLLYLQMLKWLHVFSMGTHWNMWMSAGMITLYFTQMYWTWYWLTQQALKKIR